MLMLQFILGRLISFWNLFIYVNNSQYTIYIDFSIGVICSYLHEMYVLSDMTGCEKVDSEYLNS
jgi:hypothetical protein